MFIAKNNDLIILAKKTREELEFALQIMNYTSIEETDINYILYNGEYVTEAEIAEQEKERIGKLTCTKRVFALMLQEMGIDYLTVLLPKIESNPQAKLEWDLCVELERSNPLLDSMASELGVTPEKLDGLFKYANGEITIDEFRALLNPVEVQDETESI